MVDHRPRTTYPRRLSAGTREQRIGAALVSAVVLAALGWINSHALPSRCGAFELLSTGEMADLLRTPVSTTDSYTSGQGCTYVLGDGDVLRVGIPTEYSEGDEAGLRALDLAALATGRPAVGPSDGAGRASYASTPRGETLVASYGGMQLILMLRTAKPGGTPLAPEGVRAGMVLMAHELIDRFTPDLADPDRTSAPLHAGLGSPSRDLCQDLISIAQVEDRIGLLVTYSTSDPGRYGSDCEFWVDEPNTTFVIVRVEDLSEGGSAADVAALRQVDLDAVPVHVLDETAETVLSPEGTAYTVRTKSSGLPTSHALEIRTETMRLQVSYDSVHPELTGADVETMRPALLAVAGIVIGNL
jgi:hypothetical protein